MTTLSVVIPCYNEEASLPHLFAKLRSLSGELRREYELEYIFVNDGSTDGTGEILERARSKAVGGAVRVVRHAGNRGLGAALQSGFAAASGELVAALDCDCTFDPLDLPRMLRELDEETDIVSASEYHPEGRTEGVNPVRLVFSKTLSKFYRFVFRSGLYTFSSILRVYRREVLAAIQIESSGFLSCAELMMKALAAGYCVKEVPVTLTARQHGKSKIPIVRTIASHLAFIARMRWRLWFSAAEGEASAVPSGAIPAWREAAVRR